MTASAETDYLHSSGTRCGDPVNTIFQHKAVTRCDAEFLGSKEEEIGRRLAPFDHGRAEHVRIEKS